MRAFISYRRADTQPTSGRLYDALRARYTADCLYKDVADLPLGGDARAEITEAISESVAMVVVIGPGWLKPSNGGPPRLHHANDFVRLEVERALKARLLVIPVLVDCAVMPTVDELPVELAPLAERNGLRLDHETWERDLQPLLDTLDQWLKLPAPRTEAEPTGPRPDTKVFVSRPTSERWCGGHSVTVRGTTYILHDGASQTPHRDHSWVVREATATRADDSPIDVRIRQLLVMKQTEPAERQRAGLESQARLLADIDGRAGVPKRLALCREPSRTTLISEAPLGSPWGEVFGPGPLTKEPLTAARVVDAAARVARSLAELHRRGAFHGRLDPAAILVAGSAAARLRDVGLAAVPPSRPADDRPTAPEQHHSPQAVDARTDVYLLAALVYQTMSGHPPSPGTEVPISTDVPASPRELDAVLIRCLAAEQSQRPADIAELEHACRRARPVLSRGS